jgi:hypothetical protein
MESNLIGTVLGIVLILALVALATLVGAYLHLMTKRPCPRCRVLMSKSVATCPHCGAAVLATA